MTNEKECNEIVRQFMLIDFDESMISIETIDGIEVLNDTSANMEPIDVD